MKSLDWRWVLSRPEYCLASGFGVGLSKIAPGTVGTLLGFPLYYGLAAITTPIWVLVILVGLFLSGIAFSEKIGKELGEADHSVIVWDEIVAMALVLTQTPESLLWQLAAFAIFRFFDIVKPWPISVIDRRMKNGLGVMLDDALAAIFSLGVIMMMAKLIG